MTRVPSRVTLLTIVTLVVLQSFVTGAVLPVSPPTNDAALAAPAPGAETDAGVAHAAPSCITSWFDISTRSRARDAFMNNCLGAYPICLRSLDTMGPISLTNESCLISAPRDGPYTWWNGDVDTCKPGTTTAAFKQTVIDALAYYRAWAGVGTNVSLVDEFNRKAQAAALYNAGENPFGFPPKCAKTADATAGLANSYYNEPSLFGFVAGPAFVYFGVFDRDEPSSDEWIRTAILNPRTLRYGVGAVVESPGNFNDIYSALWVTDRQSSRPATRDGFVAWPPPGWVPYQLVHPIWTFSVDGANFSKAKVRVVIDGNEEEARWWTPGVAKSKNGESTLILNSTLSAGYGHWDPPDFDTKVHVEISNVVVGGKTKSYAYDVKVFDPEKRQAQPPPTIVLSTISMRTGQVVNFTGAGWLNEKPDFSWNGTYGFDQNDSPYPTQFTLNWESDGTISGSFKVPESIPSGRNYVTVSGYVWLNLRADVFVNITTPAPKCTLSVSSAYPTSKVVATCPNFQQGERLDLYWDKTTGTPIWTYYGNDVKGTFPVPDNTPKGTHKLIVKGRTSGKTASASIEIKPLIRLSPTTGPGGTKVKVTMRGFAAGETVSVYWYDTPTTRTRMVKDGASSSDPNRFTVAVSALGTGTFTFKVPNGATVGDHTVRAEGVKVVGANLSKATKPFKVTGVSGAEVPTPTATRTPKPSPTAQATTADPTAPPTEESTLEPTSTPTLEPTEALPTDTPTEEPTAEPTATSEPTELPPTETPTPEPTVELTVTPTESPTPASDEEAPAEEEAAEG